MLNIGWVSASPIAETGYGRMTRELGYRLIDLGIPLTFIGTFGDVIIWGGTHDQETFQGNKAHILTLTDPASAPSVIMSYAAKHDFNLVIGFMDCFGLEYLNNVNMPVVGYFPIDGPWTGEMRDLARNYYRIVAFSKFGYNELLKWYPPSKVGYIDHGVDTQQFSPLKKREYADIREWMERTDLPVNESANIVPPIPRDCFLGIDLAANIGPRKNLPLLMRTWSKFVEQHPENPPHLLIQTNPYSPGRGYDLVSHRRDLKMEKYIHFPKYDPIIHPVSDEHLRKIYGASQVFVHNACAEGRCLPMVEAMSCVPYETLITSSPIFKVHTRIYHGRLINIETETGNKLSLTPNHPIPTRYGLISAKNLSLEDSIYCSDENYEVDRQRIGDIEKGVSSSSNWRTHENTETIRESHKVANHGRQIEVQTDLKTFNISKLSIGLHKMAEPETVTKISKTSTTTLRVFNLTTSSGYYSANNIIVHNCGTPPIAPDNSAQTEVVQGNGWLVNNVDGEDYIEFPVYVPTLQQYPQPSQRSLLEKLNEAYNNPDVVVEKGRTSRKYIVANYSWDKIMVKWLDLLKDIEEDLGLFETVRTALMAPKI